jgi:hypothetical protein
MLNKKGVLRERKRYGSFMWLVVLKHHSRLLLRLEFRVKAYILSTGDYSRYFNLSCETKQKTGRLGSPVVTSAGVLSQR